MSERLQDVIYVDLRPLQDENYRLRGIGLHIAALLRARRQSRFSTHKTIGLVDPQLPDLLPEFRSLVDQTTYSTNPCSIGRRAIFLDGSPMGHDSSFTARFVNHPAFLKAAVIYDFIPFDWPGYLPTVNSRIDYVARLGRLKKFDCFFPISEYSDRRAKELLGISARQTVVTGAAVRRSIYERHARHRAEPSPYDRQDPYFFITYGGDVRKNIEIVVKGVRQLNLTHGRRIVLKIAGHYNLKGAGYYDESCTRNLLRVAGGCEQESFLEFCPGVSDDELVSLYSGAIATIVPSHIEGFSLPVVEAAVCGCPAIVSSCVAHRELVDQPEALFDSTDLPSLCGRLESLLRKPVLRQHLQHSQAHLAAKFHEDAVGRLFWNGLAALAADRRAIPSICTTRKPHLAFVSPYPPDRSKSASYTASTIQAGERFFATDLFTNAPRPLTFAGSYRDAGPITRAPFLGGFYDGIISVIGDQKSDPVVSGLLQWRGGPCILHDSSALPESVLKRAQPLIVHTPTQQAEIRRRFGLNAHLLPYCSFRTFEEEEISPSAKVAVREKLGIKPGVFLVSSFGTVTAEKGVHSCIAAIDLLRSWNVHAELFFVGDATAEKAAIDRIATLFGLGKYIHLLSQRVEESYYRDLLVASDAAVQIQTHLTEYPSGSLADCINAGLPCVTTRHMAASCDAPAYVHAVPDRFSPLQLAETLAVLRETASWLTSHANARKNYVKKHSFENYARRLVEVLGMT